MSAFIFRLRFPPCLCAGIVVLRSEQKSISVPVYIPLRLLPLPAACCHGDGHQPSANQHTRVNAKKHDHFPLTSHCSCE